MSWGSKVTYLGETRVKERSVSFGIKDADRTSHVCIVGRAGNGRETLVANMALQDAARGFGMVVVDASGLLPPMLIERMGEEARKRIIHIDASDAEYPFSLNATEAFRKTSFGKQLFATYLASLYSVQKTRMIEDAAQKILGDETLTPVSLYDLVEQSKTIMAEENSTELPPLAIDTSDSTVDTLLDTGVYIRKDTFVRNVLGQPDGLFNLSQLNEGAIIIVDVSRIRMFPTRMAPIIKTFVYGSRAAAAEGNSVVKIYLNDCLRYLSDADAESLMNDRSVALTLADTIYREEDTPLREKSLSRCGTVLTFDPHPADAPLVEKAFYPFITEADLQQLESEEGVLMLTIDGVRSNPFLMRNSKLPERAQVSLQDVYGESRMNFAKSRAAVEEYFRPKPKPRPPREKPPTQEGGGPPAGDGEKKRTSGGFSDAFRSIFEQQVKAAQPPVTPPPPGATEAGAAPAAPAQEIAAAPTKPAEPVAVDENLLATLLYVPRPA